MLRERRASHPTSPMPRPSIAYVDGSGTTTAVVTTFAPYTLLADVTWMLEDWPNTKIVSGMKFGVLERLIQV